MTVRQERSGKILFLGVSEIGEVHVKNGKPNQDAIGFYSLDDSFFLALSDGLGSRKNSHIGAQTAVSICNDVFLEIISKQLTFESYIIKRRILELWETAFSEVDASDYSATLKVIFLVNNKLIAISIGDGLLFIRAKDDIHTIKNENCNFLNETVCLSANTVTDNFTVFERDITDHVFLLICTDGISNGISQGREQELFEEISASDNFQILHNDIKNMLIEMSNYNSDDKTIGLVRYGQ
jgi:serine/threonine protein phosphatase PrpC